jgi:hypothetical protein
MKFEEKLPRHKPKSNLGGWIYDKSLRKQNLIHKYLVLPKYFSTICNLAFFIINVNSKSHFNVKHVLTYY